MRPGSRPRGRSRGAAGGLLHRALLQDLEQLADALGQAFELAPDLDHVPDGDVVMLENIRFEPGETKNDPELAKRYAALADV